MRYAAIIHARTHTLKTIYEINIYKTCVHTQITHIHGVHIRIYACTTMQINPSPLKLKLNSTKWFETIFIDWESFVPHRSPTTTWTLKIALTRHHRNYSLEIVNRKNFGDSFEQLNLKIKVIRLNAMKMNDADYNEVVMLFLCPLLPLYYTGLYEISAGKIIQIKTKDCEFQANLSWQILGIRSFAIRISAYLMCYISRFQFLFESYTWTFL